MNDLLGVALAVAGALEACGVPYSVEGSLASSFGGEPRASIDIDILVAMTAATIDPFLHALGHEFYADAAALARAVTSRSSTNVIHHPSGIKVDLFVAGSRLDQHQLDRKRRIQVTARPDRFLYIHSPEDILLQKLHWYHAGGGVSDRQWRDVVAVILVQGSRLDNTYLTRTAAEIGVSDLLERAYADAKTR